MTEQELSDKKSFALFHELVSSTLKGLEVHAEEEMDKDEIEDLWDEEDLNSKVTRLVKNDIESNDEYEEEEMDRFSLNYYKTLMEKEEVNEEEDDLDDPEIMIQIALDSSILAMKSELVKALTSRKQSVLPLALQIFNKVQD